MHAAAHDGPPEGGVLPGGVARLDVGAALEQEPHGGGAAGRGRGVQRGRPVGLAAGVYVQREAQVEHEPHRLGVPVIGGFDQDPVVVGGEPGGQPGVGGEDLFGLGAAPLAAGAQETVGRREVGAGTALGQQRGRLGLALTHRELVGGAAVGARDAGVGAPLEEQAYDRRGAVQRDGHR